MWNNKTDNVRCVVYFLCTSLLYEKKHVSMLINVLPQRCSSNNTTKTHNKTMGNESCVNTLLHDTVSLYRCLCHCKHLLHNVSYVHFYNINTHFLSINVH